jgi:hypothetical protein
MAVVKEMKSRVPGQISAKRDKAGKEFRQFVNEGIGEASLRTDVRRQTLPGEDELMNGLVDRLSGLKKCLRSRKTGGARTDRKRKPVIIRDHRELRKED